MVLQIRWTSIYNLSLNKIEFYDFSFKALSKLRNFSYILKF